jgi:DNA gyrase/topoisomerase IV subunit B
LPSSFPYHTHPPTTLPTTQVRKLVDQAVTEQLGAWLDAHPAALSAIVGKALTAARAAEAARKARELVRRKSSLTSSTLPGKLADCTSSNRWVPHARMMRACACLAGLSSNVRISA